MTAICNIAIDITALKKLHWFVEKKEPQEIFLYMPPGEIVAMF